MSQCMKSSPRQPCRAQECSPSTSPLRRRSKPRTALLDCCREDTRSSAGSDALEGHVKLQRRTVSGFRSDKSVQSKRSVRSQKQDRCRPSELLRAASQKLKAAKIRDGPVQTLLLDVIKPGGYDNDGQEDCFVPPDLVRQLLASAQQARQGSHVRATENGRKMLVSRRCACVPASEDRAVVQQTSREQRYCETYRFNTDEAGSEAEDLAFI